MSGTVPDIPRLYTALAEWGACLLYIMMMKRKLHGVKLFAVSAGMLLSQSVFLYLTGMLNIIFWIPCMVFAIGMMILFFLVTCECSIYDSVYFGIRAFVLAEMAASLEWQVYCFFWPEQNASLPVRIVLLVLFYVLIGAAVWRLEKSQLEEVWHLGINGKELAAAFLMGVVIFAISNMSFITGNTPFSGTYPMDIMNIRTLVDIGGYAILYAHHVQCCQTRTWREAEATKYILQNQYAQYRQSRESIDMINRKYHDLKHQITAIRMENDPEKRSAWLDEMESDIKTYEAQNKTGNTVLDTLLTGKSLYCQKHNITLTCVADGALLNFMDVMDICSIFGNALDNAIECEKKLPDKEKRLIHVTVSSQKNFILLKFENYYEGELKLEAGLPVTTKEDTEYHGYGIKSIQYVAQKYGGTATVGTAGNWFELKVLLPAQSENNQGNK